MGNYISACHLSTSVDAKAGLEKCFGNLLENYVLCLPENGGSDFWHLFLRFGGKMFFFLSIAFPFPLHEWPSEVARTASANWKRKPRLSRSLKNNSYLISVTQSAVCVWHYAKKTTQRDMRALSCGRFALTDCSVAGRKRWVLGVTCLNGRCVYHMWRD